MASSAADNPNEYSVWYALPSYFHEIPLYGPEARAARNQLIEILTTASGDVAEEQRAAGAVLATYDLLLEVLRDERVLHFGVCLLRDDATESLTTAFLSLFARDIPRGDRKLAVSAAVQGTRSIDPDADVRPVELPCGPAALVKRESTTSSSPAERDETAAWRPADGSQRIRQVQYLIPYPGGGRMCVLDVTTTFLQNADTYADIADGVAHGFCFEDPFEALGRERQAEALKTRIKGALNPE